jgi:hypothetical protein
MVKYDKNSFAELKEGSNVISCLGNASFHQLKLVLDEERGHLSVGNFPSDIPFIPKRYFLVFDVPSNEYRGQHAHHNCHQFLVCIKGSLNLEVDNGQSKCDILLDSPELGAYLPPLTWGVQHNYSRDSVLLVFASDYYESSDYIRDYDEFLELTNN